MKTEWKTKGEKTPVSARDDAPVIPVADPADENVDACIALRLLPDDTAAWPPRAVGLGFGVPEGEDFDAACEEGRPSADAGKASRINTDRSSPAPAAAVVGDAHATGRGASEPALRPTPEGNHVRSKSLTTALFRFEPENSATNGRATDEAVKETVAGIIAEATFPSGWLRTACFEAHPSVVRTAEDMDRKRMAFFAERPGAKNGGRKEISPPIVDREEPEAFRVVSEWVPGIWRRKGNEYVAAGGRTAFEEGKKTEFFASFSERTVPASTGTAVGGRTGEISDVVAFGYPRQLWDTVSEAPVFVPGNAREKVRNGRFSPWTDGATASARRPDTAVHPACFEWFDFPAIDVGGLAQRADTTVQILDNASAWNAGLPDLSGVALTDKPGGGMPGAGRNPARYGAASVPAASAPAAAPTVQVNATLRVDEEELLCAVERMATRHALRG